MDIWRAVKGFEGYYEVSYSGKIRSLDRIIFDKHGHKKRHKQRIIKQQVSNKGYRKVSLTRDCKKTTKFAHRLVAIAFKPNPKNLPTVNHRDELKLHNAVHNLEWMTFEDNANYGTAQIRAHLPLINGPCSKKVYQYTLDGEFVKSYPSVAEAGRSTDFCSKKVSAVARGERNSHKGFYFSYSERKARENG